MYRRHLGSRQNRARRPSTAGSSGRRLARGRTLNWYPQGGLRAHPPTDSGALAFYAGTIVMASSAR